MPIAPLFPDVAKDALGVFCSLQVYDLPRKKNGKLPTLGEVVDQNILDLVGAIFGSEDPVSKRRLIRRFMLLISKKNGKSLIAAGVMLTALIVGWRPNAAKLIIAPTIKIANNSFEPAVGMVRADPELSALLHIVENQRLIKHRTTGCELRVVAADSETLGGIKAGEVLVEELWLFGKKAKSAAMLREALGGMAAREEGFVFYISTHSDEPPAGVFKTELQYFRDVRDGIIPDPETLGALYEWPAEMLESGDYLDEARWYVTNPHIDRIPSLSSFIRAELAKAKHGEGEDEQLVLAKHLNVEIGLRTRRDRWMGADYWEDATEPGLTLDQLVERCEVIVAGIDYGGADDLFGLAVAGREAGTGVWLAWAHAYARRVVLDRRKDIASVLQGFADDGDLTLTDTAQEMVDLVAARVVALRDTGKMPEVGALGVDAWGMGGLLEALVAGGFEPYDEVTRKGGSIASVRQGVGLTGTIKTVEFKLVDGMLRHGGSRLMAWCVSNAKAELRGSNLYIAKERAGVAKIDPLIAMLNAVQMLELGPVAATSKKAGVIFL